MPTKASDARLQRIRDALAEGGQHSKLHRWMVEQYPALRRLFAENGPQWPKLLAFFAEEGLTDADGKPPTLRGAQQTWYRIGQRMRAAERSKPTARSGKRLPLTTAPSRVPGASPQPAPVASADAVDATLADFRKQLGHRDPKLPRPVPSE